MSLHVEFAASVNRGCDATLDVDPDSLGERVVWTRPPEPIPKSTPIEVYAVMAAVFGLSLALGAAAARYFL